MESNFCGKSCAECACRQDTGCRGCAEQGAAECGIAKCCREKGHEGCGACAKRAKCKVFSKRNNMPKLRAEAERLRAQVRDNVPTTIRCTGALLWMFLLQILLSFISTIGNVNTIPALDWIIQICISLCTIAEGTIFMRLAAVNSKFRAAAMIKYMLALLGIVGRGMSAAAADLLFVKSLVQVSMIFGAIAEYYICSSFADTLANIDGMLAHKWRRLWKVYVGAIIAMDLVEGIAYISTIAAGLLMSACGIALIAVFMLKPVYLLRTRKAFCNLSAQTSANS